MKSEINRRASEGWVAGWDEAYERAFGKDCSACKDKGYYLEFDQNGNPVKQGCLLCLGTGKRRING